LVANRDCTLKYGGETNIKGKNGTGLILDKHTGKSLIGFEPVMVEFQKHK
jgi:hypothetical protein